MRSQAAVFLAFLTVTATFAVFVPPANALTHDDVAQSSSTISDTKYDDQPIFVSPITNLRYEIITDQETGASFYRLGNSVYLSLDSIFEYEASMFPNGMYKIEPPLRDNIEDVQEDGRLPLIIYLAPKFGHDVSMKIRASFESELYKLWDHRQALLERIMSLDFLGPLPPNQGSVSFALDAEFQRVNTQYTDAFVLMRQMIYEETEKLNAPSQDDVIAKIENLGGVVNYRGPFVNVIAARLSPEGLRELVNDPLIESVHRDVPMTARLDVSVPALGAPDWWSAGYNTPTYKLVVADTGIDSTHPALGSIITDEEVFHDLAQLQFDYNDNPSSTDDLHGHGTHIAGIVASQDSTYRGVAYGLNGVVNAKWGYLTTSGGGSGQWPDMMKAIDWAIFTAGASVVSFSYGTSVNGDGSSGATKFVDAVVDDLGIPFAVAAGNDGPSANTVGIPADTYNGVSVGAINDQGTVSRADDTIAGFSSRGPTGDNRLKPDVVSFGVSINSCNNDWESSSDWVNMPGTSMAAPHVAAATILLLNYLGPRGFFAAIPKALMIQNAQDKGAVGPDNNYGYGSVDMNLTLQNKDKVYNSTVTPQNATFYKGTWTGTDKATLVWQRHVVYRTANYPATFYTLNNLNLYRYNGANNALTGSSTSAIDNVEQLSGGAAVANAVLKIKAMSALSGVTEEPFAIATSTAFTWARPPTFQIEWDGPLSVEAGASFDLTANVTNIGDLTAFGTSGVLTVPSGLTLLAGSNPVSLGDMTPGTRIPVTWTFQGISTGNQTLTFNVSSTSYQEDFYNNVSYTVRVMDSFPPQVLGVWAAPSPQNAGLNVNITAQLQDNLGIFRAQANVTNPRGTVGNFTMTRNGLTDIWYIEQPYYIAGLHDVVVWASDMDNWDWNVTSFMIIDSTPPNIISHSAIPSVQQIHGNVNVTARIQDQAGIENAWVEITDPLATTFNYSLLSIGDDYWWEQQYDILGTYDYTIIAMDPTGNKITGNGVFDIVDTIKPVIQSYDAQPNPQLVFGYVNITATITDVGGVVNAWVDITDPLASSVNTTLQRNGDNFWLNQSYSVLGTYTYTISAVDIVNQWATVTDTFVIGDTIPPLADAGPDQIVGWSTIVTFDGSGSSDNFGISSYEWSFIDLVPINLTGVSPSYQFMRVGVYFVTLKVEDFSNNTATDLMTVTVKDYTPPVITNETATPNPQNVNEQVEIKATITDNVGVVAAWVIVRDPIGALSNNSMTLISGDEYANTQVYTRIGTHSYEIWAMDAAGNKNSLTRFFSIADLERPWFAITEATPDPQQILNTVRISADIRDNVAVTDAWVEITRPGGIIAGNYSMLYDFVLGRHRYVYSTQDLGVHTFIVTATDNAGNTNVTNGQFLVHDIVPPTISPTTVNLLSEVDLQINYTAFASDDYMVDQAFAEISEPGGGSTNHTLSFSTGVGPNTYVLIALNNIDTYQVTLSVRDTSGNWGTSTATITIIDSQPPVANAGPDQNVLEDDLVHFDGSGSTDQHAIESYSWTFTDNGNQIVLTGINPSHTFTIRGDYIVTLEVVDYGGNTDSDVMVVHVTASNTGNDPNGNGDNFFNELFTKNLPILIILIVAIILIIAALIIRHGSKKREEQELKRRRAARARLRAKRAAMQRKTELLPPPDEEMMPPPPDEYAPPPPPDMPPPPPE